MLILIYFDDLMLIECSFYYYSTTVAHVSVALKRFIIEDLQSIFNAIPLAPLP
jgi:hypothetical protein